MSTISYNWFFGVALLYYVYRIDKYIKCSFWWISKKYILNISNNGPDSVNYDHLEKHYCTDH